MVLTSVIPFDFYNGDTLGISLNEGRLKLSMTVFCDM